MRIRFRRKPRIEYRARICNKGSIFRAPDPTPWTTSHDDPQILEMIRQAREDGLRVLDHCPTPPWEWELHQRHLLIESRDR